MALRNEAEEGNAVAMPGDEKPMREVSAVTAASPLATDSIADPLPIRECYRSPPLAILFASEAPQRAMLAEAQARAECACKGDMRRCFGDGMFTQLDGCREAAPRAARGGGGPLQVARAPSAGPARGHGPGPSPMQARQGPLSAGRTDSERMGSAGFREVDGVVQVGVRPALGGSWVANRRCTIANSHCVVGHRQHSLSIADGNRGKQQQAPSRAKAINDGRRLFRIRRASRSARTLPSRGMQTLHPDAIFHTLEHDQCAQVHSLCGNARAEVTRV
jgi:hypothetical protein